MRLIKPTTSNMMFMVRPKDWFGRGSRVYAALFGICGFLLIAAGCSEPDSLGRFRATPVTNIILDELGVVDEEPEVFAGARDPRAEDLQVKAEEYIIESGDVLDISVFELFQIGMEWMARRQVSETGRLTLPIVGTFMASGRTELELTEDIKQLISPHIIKDPKVSVVLVGSRERVFSISGAVSQPGRFPISEVDFRISEALAQAGGIPQYNADYAYVVRTLRLDEMVSASDEISYGREPQPMGIEAFSPLEPSGPAGNEPVPAESTNEPESPAPMTPEQELLESVAPMSGYVSMVEMPAHSSSSQTTPPSKVLSKTKTPVDLAAVDVLDSVRFTVNQTTESPDKPFKIIRRGERFELTPQDGSVPSLPGPDQEGLAKPEPLQAPLPPLPPYSGRTAEEVGQAGRVQEVIRIDLKSLRGGNLSQNIVIRPGDEIRIPFNSVGVFYVMGMVARPGPYSLTGNRMTVKRALAAAGPLSSLAWPSRCEITRIIGDNTEVIYRVNLEKLLTGAAPDVFIKPDDVINIGSHPVARWLAVVRQSFRYTYGFGFVYDRNFADKDIGH